MNPDSGRLHEIAEIAGIERIAKGGTKEETVEEVLKRAADEASAKAELSSEPPPGTPVPKDWPRFSIGDRIGPIKGWWFQLVYVDVEEQKLVIQPLEPTKTTKTKRVGKKRKRTKCGSRKRRKKFK